MCVCVPRRSWLEIFSKYNRTLNSTRFMTIYGYVQSNIQHDIVSPAYGASTPAPTGALPLDSGGDLRPPDPFFCPSP